MTDERVKQAVLKWAESDSKLVPEDLVEGLKAMVRIKTYECPRHKLTYTTYCPECYKGTTRA